MDLSSDSRLIRTAILAVLCVLGGLGLWSAKAELAEVIILSGEVTSENRRHVINHPSGGKIIEIMVKDGTEVNAGDVLMRFDDTKLRAELELVRELYAELQALVNRLEAERHGLDEIIFDPDMMIADGALYRAREAQILSENKKISQLEIDQIDQQINQVHRQIGGLEAQKSAIQSQLYGLNTTRADLSHLLERGMVEIGRIRELDFELAGVETRLGEVRAQIAGANAKVIELEIVKLRIINHRKEAAREELKTLRPKLTELRARKQSLQSDIDLQAIKAPIDGVVYGVSNLNEGRTIRASETILYIAPTDRADLVSLSLPAHRIGEVFVGQTAFYRMATASSDRTQNISAKIIYISPDATLDEESRKRYFQVTLQTTLPVARTIAPLSIGTPVEAFIQVGSKNPIAYVLSPLRRYLEKGFSAG